MRIRSIKPEFFKNEHLPELPYEDRLLFIGLWCLADSNGVLEDRPRRIAVEVFPYDFTDASPMLHRLHEAGFIIRYTVDGKDYISIPSFRKHQRLSGKEAQSDGLYPLPTSEAMVKQAGSNGEAVNASGTGNREQGTGDNTRKNSGSFSDSPCPHSEMQSYWNELASKSGLRRSEVWPEKEARARWKQKWFRDSWGYIFQECHEATWCKENHAGPDHVLREANARRYYELVLPKLRKEGVI